MGLISRVSSRTYRFSVMPKRKHIDLTAPDDDDEITFVGTTHRDMKPRINGRPLSATSSGTTTGKKEQKDGNMTPTQRKLQIREWVRETKEYDERTKEMKKKVNDLGKVKLKISRRLDDMKEKCDKVTTQAALKEREYFRQHA